MAVMSTSTRIADFKKRGVDIVATAAEHGVKFDTLDEKTQAAILDIASAAWFAGGEAYL